MAKSEAFCNDEWYLVDKNKDLQYELKPNKIECIFKYENDSTTTDYETIKVFLKYSNQLRYDSKVCVINKIPPEIQNIKYLDVPKVDKAYYIHNKKNGFKCIIIVYSIDKYRFGIKIVRIDDLRFKYSQLCFNDFHKYNIDTVYDRVTELIFILIQKSPGLKFVCDNYKCTRTNNIDNLMKSIIKTFKYNNNFKLKCGDIISRPLDTSIFVKLLSPIATQKFGKKSQNLQHVGVYIDDDTVIHYTEDKRCTSGDSKYYSHLIPQKTNLKQFLDGCKNIYAKKDLEITTFIIPFMDESLIKQNAINAMNKIKRKDWYRPQYNLLNNNCQHFAFGCVTGISYSVQGSNFNLNILKDYGMAKYIKSIEYCNKHKNSKYSKYSELFGCKK